MRPSEPLMSPHSQSSPGRSYGVLRQEPDGDDIDLAAERVRRLGFAVFDAGLGEQELQTLSSAFDQTREAYIQCHGRERLERIDELNTVRAPLVHGDPWFLRLATLPRLLALVSRLISGTYILNQQNGVINPPGHDYNQGAWHRDLPYQHFVSSRPIAVNALFCLDAFRSDNGATHVLPASHRAEDFPSSAFVQEQALQVLAPAGSFLVLDAMLFHSGGSNRSGQERRAVNHLFTIPYIKQQICLPECLSPDGLDAAQRALLGFRNVEPPSVDAYLQSKERR